MSTLNGIVVVKALIAWLLRIVAAYVLACLGAVGVCYGTQLVRWYASDYVCGHNAYLVAAPLFFVFWVALELGLPVLLRRMRSGA